MVDIFCTGLDSILNVVNTDPTACAIHSQSITAFKAVSVTYARLQIPVSDHLAVAVWQLSVRW